jgi:hypothetical protein
MSTTTETTDEAPPETPPTPTAELLHDIAEEAPLRDPVRRRRVLLGLAGIVIVLALVVGLLRLVGLVGGESDEEKDAAAIEKVQARVLPQLQDLMAKRETFFAAERVYLPAMKQANAAVATYNRRLARGGHPALPRLTAEVTALQRVAKDMTALRTTLAEMKSDVGVTMDAHDYLLGAARALGTDAGRNAAALQKSGAPIRLVAVADDNALTSIKRMNKSLLFVLAAVRLPVSDFDLPGGTDKDKNDHSTSM